MSGDSTFAYFLFAYNLRGLLSPDMRLWREFLFTLTQPGFLVAESSSVAVFVHSDTAGGGEEVYYRDTSCARRRTYSAPGF